MTNIEIIATTKEVENLSGEELKYEQTLLGGKFGGTCYAAQGYDTIRKQPVEKALNRAKNTAQSGHHSVFQHGMVNMEINCPKIIAMLLNSIGISNTSEKSARYTQMHPDTQEEQFYYQKWHDILLEKIREQYGTLFSEREMDKLAYENARYMISVFCQTSMVYSLPFRNISYVIQWTERMIENLKGLTGKFNERLGRELTSLKEAMEKAVGGTAFLDLKNEYFHFMPVQALGEYDDDNREYYGDVYTAKFLASFAQVAQEQRHRTTRVKINFSGDDPKEFGFFVPPILVGTPEEKQWLQDMEEIGFVYPQGMLVSVTEQGLFEDFALKCKERMCGRAQLEIMQVTEQVLEKFIENRENLSKANLGRLENMLDQGKPCARCGYKDFTCVEGCPWGKNKAMTRLI